MKKTLILLAAAMALCACQINLGDLKNLKIGNNKTVRCDGEVIEKTFDYSGFDAISVKGNANVVFVQDGAFLVSVKANKEVFDYLEFKLDDGKLVISTEDGVNIIAKTYKVTVQAPLLTDVNVSGAADLDIVDGYSSEEPLDIEIHGAGDLSFVGVSVPSLDIEVHGAADLDIVNAIIPELSVAVHGAGDVDIENVESDSVSLTVRGAGDARITGTSRSADFHVAGAGSIDARSLKCENVTTAKSGAATIRL